MYLLSLFSHFTYSMVQIAPI